MTNKKHKRKLSMRPLTPEQALSGFKVDPEKVKKAEKRRKKGKEEPDSGKSEDDSV